MPAAVEVMVAGLRLVYPTSYVLVTDYDTLSYNSNPVSDMAAGSFATKKSMHTCESLDDVPLIGFDTCHEEPSPFTTSNHTLLAN